jgi:hypothetical protein
MTVKWPVYKLFWVIAWTAWLCCGVGFYHQLPREWGRAVRTMGLEGGERCVGFLHGREAVLTQIDGDDGVTRLKSRDAHTGRTFLENAELASPSNLDYVPTTFSLRHGVVVGAKVGAGPTKRILKLETGDWFELGPANLKVHAFHRADPLVIVSRPGDPTTPPRVSVVQLDSLEHVFEWNGEPAKEGVFESIRACFFDPRTDSIIAIRERVVGDWERIAGQELLRLPLDRSTPPKPVKLERSYGHISAPAKNGLMLFHGANEQNGRWDVIDSHTGELVFTNDGRPEPPRKFVRWQNKHDPVPLLSAEGNAVLTPNQFLWDVRAKRLIWQPDQRYEDEVSRAPPTDFLATEFPIREDWRWLFTSNRPPDWLSFLREPTTTVRSMETGRVQFRLWQENIPQHLSSDGRLALAYSTVHSYPPPANWKWLAICQTVLALPLGLLWLVLRWRRNRRLKALGGM